MGVTLKKITVRQLVVIGLMAALCLVSNYFSIPIPIGIDKSRIHLGNVFCILSAFMLGPVGGGCLCKQISDGLCLRWTFEAFNPGRGTAAVSADLAAGGSLGGRMSDLRGAVYDQILHYPVFGIQHRRGSGPKRGHLGDGCGQGVYFAGQRTYCRGGGQSDLLFYCGGAEKTASVYLND